VKFKTQIDRLLAKISNYDLSRYKSLFSGTPHDEKAFYPAALEIVETPPSPASRAIAMTIIVFFVVSLLWASIGSVDVIAVAPGKIIPTGRTKIIQPMEAGVIRAIRVHDGQAVKAGEVLLEIDPTINGSERDRLRQDHIRALLDIARLMAATNISGDAESGFMPPAEATPTQIETQRVMLLNQQSEVRAKLSAFDEQITQNEGNRHAVDQTISKIREAIPFLQERARIRRDLARKGYSSKIDNLTSQQDLSEHQNELRVQQARLVEAGATVQALTQQRRQAEAEYQRTVLTALADAQQKAATFQEQLKQAEQKYRLQTLTAPVDGTVQQLAVHTEGGVVTPAQALLVIVPADSNLEIEAMISNRDIGFVYAGQDAGIKVDTFNFTKYGLLHGKVISVSQDAITRTTPSDKSTNAETGSETNGNSEPNGQEYVYAARIALVQTTMNIDGKNVKLNPGMAVTAEIKTSSRHVIDYLLSPLQSRTHQALRER
jgi:hemolysin D